MRLRPLVRRVALPAVLLASVVGGVACGDDTSTSTASSATPVTASPTTAAGLVAVVSTETQVAFYPACGNETLDHDGVRWYTAARADGGAVDEAFEEVVDRILGVAREPWSPPSPSGLLRVAEPGPGDDVGTLVVWADGVARWTSASGNLDVWLVDDELTYAWVC